MCRTEALVQVEGYPADCPGWQRQPFLGPSNNGFGLTPRLNRQFVSEIRSMSAPFHDFCCMKCSIRNEIRNDGLIVENRGPNRLLLRMLEWGNIPQKRSLVI